jgi:DNA-binding MarR family transcriptional regulator
MASRLPTDVSTFFKIIRLVNLTARPFVERVGKTHHLTLNEWRVMVALASHPGIAATEVTDITGMDKMSVSRAIAGLVSRERLDKTPDVSDGRRILLRLSKAGVALFETIGPHAKAREEKLFATLGQAGVRELDAMLDRVLKNLGDGK